MNESPVAAFIDLGTNAVRMTIASFADPAAPVVLALRREQVRLGEGTAADGSLGAAAVARALAACTRAVAESREAGAREIVAVATAAVRGAPNGGELLALVRDVCGLEMRVLTGDEEAALVYRGVRACARPQAARICCVDIGGGSTEFVVGDAGRVELARSVPVGAVRLASEWGLLSHGDAGEEPVGDAAYDGLKGAARELLRPAAAEVARRAPEAVFGVAGTLRTLALVAAAARSEEPTPVMALSRDDVERVAGALRRVPLGARRLVRGLEPERADVIVPGTAIAEVVFELLGIAETAVVLACGIRDGLMAEYATTLAEQGPAVSHADGAGR